VLIDEIENALSEVFSLLLQLLDDGRLTNGQVVTVDFRNTVVIMTSNLGNQLWEGGQTVSRNAITQVLQSHFRPEFLNRFDGNVIFHTLGKEQLTRIVDILLQHVSRRMADKGYSLDVSAGTRDYLAEVGYHPDFGARPLKRAIQRELQDSLALKILAGEFKVGDTIYVGRGSDGLVLSSGVPNGERVVVE
jgi:ATP-dependent Clp protease ATP-binding subunit ClpB